MVVFENHNPMMQYLHMFSRVRFHLATLLLVYKFTPCMAKCSHNDDIADCSYAHLTSIPTNLPPHIRLLHLNNNLLGDVGNSSFAHLPQLTNISLNNNLIGEINQNAFSDQAHLLRLELRNNTVTSLSFISNSIMRELVYLDASWNQLATVAQHDLDQTVNLRVLDLSSNRIISIHKHAFTKLKSLITLNLSANRLTIPSQFWFTQISTSLQHLNMSANPWMCNCEMIDFRTWVKSCTYTFKKQLNVKCDSPDGNRNKTITSLHERDFVCAASPAISTLTLAPDSPQHTASTTTTTTTIKSTTSTTPATTTTIKATTIPTTTTTTITTTIPATTMTPVSYVHSHKHKGGIVNPKLQAPSSVHNFPANEQNDHVQPDATKKREGAPTTGAPIQHPTAAAPAPGSNVFVDMSIVLAVCVLLVVVSMWCARRRRRLQRKDGEAYGLLNDETAFKPVDPEDVDVLMLNSTEAYV